MRAAVFLDRDGVVNQPRYDPEHGLLDSPSRADQFRLSHWAVAGLRVLQRADLALVVVSNQPGVAKGTMTMSGLGDVTDRMVHDLAAGGVVLDGVYYCLHHPSTGTTCPCRKPAPGMLRQAAADLGLDLARSWMVGDGVPDVQAGRAAGCRTVWIGQWKCEGCQAFARSGQPPPSRAADLVEAAELITRTRRRRATVSRLRR